MAKGPNLAHLFLLGKSQREGSVNEATKPEILFLGPFQKDLLTIGLEDYINSKPF